MAYLVKITERAERDLEQIYQAIHADHSSAAVTWYRGLKESILGLVNFPKRCPLISKRTKLRHLLYGHQHNVYRVIYKVIDPARLVEIIHIRHGSRRRSPRNE